MPRHNNDRENRLRQGRDGSKSPIRSKRQKRSRSRDAHDKPHRRSPDLSKFSSYQMKRKERNYSPNRQSNYSSDKLAGKWAKEHSDSEDEKESENMKNQRSRKLDRDLSYNREERKKHNVSTHTNERPDNNMSGKLDDSETKQGPNMALSGKLMEDTNVFNGVTVKYSEPPEAKKPKRRWRFYVFKGEETMPVLHLHRQSAYLLGKDRKVADIPIDHPSCSRQHAVLQYRCIPGSSADGQKITRVLPYIIDLESSNGTFLNNKKIDPKRYMELREKDVLKFGFSSREYVLLHDQSDGDE